MIIPYRRGDVLHLYTPGDEHQGPVYHAEKAHMAVVNQIKNDPYGMWVGMGDKSECITPSDKRWEWGVLEDWCKPNNIARTQEDHYCDSVASISDKCAGLLEGNHEDAIRIHNHDDVHGNICKNLGVDSLGYTCYIKFTFRRLKSKESHSFIGFFTHGAGCAVTPGAKLTRLHRISNTHTNTRFVAHGHVHDIIADYIPAMTLMQNMEVKNIEKAVAMTGCFFRTYTVGVRASYGEKKNYSPTTIGTTMFTINPNTDTVNVERVKPISDLTVEV